MPGPDPSVASAFAFIALWTLVGICPDNWPFPRFPRVPPPPPPWWSKFVGIAGAIAAGWAFTGAAASGVGGSSVLNFAATAVFALVGAVAAREVVGALVPAGAVAAGQQAGFDAPANFR